jgi:hypothetical protein
MSGNQQNRMITLYPGDMEWRLMTDQVMGGVSSGRVIQDSRAGRDALVLSGHVSTKNNGGFIQVVGDITRELADRASECSGVRLCVYGDGNSYNIHLRTRDLLLPWQSYRAEFSSDHDWQTIEVPFERFAPYKTGIPLSLSGLKRIGIVAIGRDFDADIAIGEISFYTN